MDRMARWRARLRGGVLPALVIVAWAIGVALRFAAPGIIEYKGDEQYSFEVAEDIVHGKGWPGVGMDSSVGLPNPGMSVWVFGILAFVSRATNPVALARAVAWLNVGALTWLFVLAWARSGPSRPVWLWGAALTAVDPLGIIYQRKIWPPCVLPLLLVAFFVAWEGRRRPRAAAAWGLVGAVMAQIHMAAAFYVTAFAAWSVYAHFSRTRREPVHWKAWWAGSVAGSLLAISWLVHLRGFSFAHNAPPPPSAQWGNFWRMWMENVVGSGVEASIGPEHMRALRLSPIVDGSETSLVEVALAASLVVSIVLATSAVWSLLANREAFVARLRWNTAVAHNIVLFGYGGLLVLSPFVIWRHYLILTYPFSSFSLPLLVSLGARRFGWLGVVWVAQAFVSACLIVYLVHHHGAPGGDFGTAFVFQ
jgi:hypothetical protein